VLLERTACTLLVVDLQQRLLPHIHEGERALSHSVWLVRLAQRLEVPVLATEQYPDGLGPTVPALRRLLGPDDILEKVHFSALADGGLQQRAQWQARQFVVAGVESHVCVLQTALDLLEAGKQVFVLADAVASRDPANRDLGVQRLRQCGAEIVAREMVAFEWLGRAATDEFREVNREFLR
jgi:nicotinamidase-related amidase